jgi:integrase
MCGIEQQSSKRRLVGQSNLRSQSNREVQFKLGYQRSGRVAHDICSQVDFMPALTYQRQYSRLVHHWVKSIGLEAASYGTHSMRRTKVAQIYRKTGNLRAVQLLLGHTKLESTVRYLGIEIDDALSMAEQIDL